MIRIPNSQVACTPFPNFSVKGAQVGKGLLAVQQKVSLVPLTVVYGSLEDKQYKPGMTVWVRGECAKDLWATKYEILNQQVILVPFNQILAVDDVEVKVLGESSDATVAGVCQ